MRETPRSLISRLREIASALDEPALDRLVGNLESIAGTSVLRLMVVGRSGAGRFSTVNALVGQPQLLPISPFPKAPVRVIVRYGDEVSFALRNAERAEAIVDRASLKALLRVAPVDGGADQFIEVRANSQLLRHAELVVEDLDSDRSANEWIERVADVHYVILVLRATSVLSAKEQLFIRDILHPHVGLGRVVIVVNQMDLVAEHDRSGIAERVHGFLGPFDGQPAIIYLSAARANKAIERGDVPSACGYDALTSLMMEDLVGQQAAVSAAAFHQTARTAIAQIADVVARRLALLATDESDLQRLARDLDSRDGWLQERSARSQRMVESSINTLLKERFLAEIAEFGRALREQLPTEVAGVADLQLVRRHLPGYLESVWKDFLNRQIVWIQRNLTLEIKRIAEVIDADLSQYLESSATHLAASAPGLQTASTAALLMPRRSDDKTANVATWLQLGGLAVALVYLPVGLGLFGTGQVLRLMHAKESATADREAIVGAAEDAIREMEQQHIRFIGQRFQSLTEDLNGRIEETYRQGATTVCGRMKEALRQRKALETQRQNLEELSNATVPELVMLLEKATSGYTTLNSLGGGHNP